MKSKVITVVGARPQFIKAAAVSRLLRNSDFFEEVFLHTGQHYDDKMSDIFFSELELPKPEYNLAIGSGGHGKQTGEMLTAIEQVLIKEKPQWLLVYGDTNSTLAGVLAASKLHIPVAHVEAGLRSFNRKMPEEINRIVADQLSELLFVPTQIGVENLQREGIDKHKIHYVGDVMYDAALYYGEKAASHSDVLARLKLESKKYLLVTIHRAENTDNKERLTAIFDALCLLKNDITVVLPLHPRTRKMLEQFGLLEKAQQALRLIEPVGFLDMVMLERQAKAIATDSGGVQKEAFFHKVPCVTLRDETEWVELVDLGWNRVVSPNNAGMIKSAMDELLLGSSGKHAEPYGKGNAAESLVEIMRKHSR